MRPYKSREGGPGCTIFVPYDCNNSCPFCTHKAEYADTTGFSLPEILKKIALVDSVIPCCDIAITGGEPFANSEGLNTIIKAIPNTHKLFINTTFPCNSSEQLQKNMQVLENNRSKITGINISRHLLPYVGECGDNIIAALPVKTRINCVLNSTFTHLQIRNFAQRWAKYNIPIQFRYDYMKTTPEILHNDSSDKILKCLNEEFTFVSSEGCRIRNSYKFEYCTECRKPEEIFYRKALPNSTVVEKDQTDGVVYDILYDIIIRQDGNLCSDWDYTKLDIERFKTMKFEPDDMHIIKQRA